MERKNIYNFSLICFILFNIYFYILIFLFLRRDILAENYNIFLLYEISEHIPKNICLFYVDNLAFFGDTCKIFISVTGDIVLYDVFKIDYLDGKINIYELKKIGRFIEHDMDLYLYNIFERKIIVFFLIFDNSI